jgi:eukaryotic-like serine/threonine-protein kinase
MRAFCRLSDAELAVNDLANAERYADSAAAFFNEFKLTSPSLIVLRDIGLCDESMGKLQHRIAMDRSLSPSERNAAETASRQWYGKSLDVWNEWVRRGGSTPESETERRKVERLLATMP